MLKQIPIKYQEIIKWVAFYTQMKLSSVWEKKIQNAN